MIDITNAQMDQLDKKEGLYHSHIDFSRMRFEKSLTDISFNHCRFFRGEFEKITLTRCNFSYCDFMDASFDNVDFKDCTIQGCSFSCSNMDWVSFVKGSIKGSSFQGTVLERVKFLLPVTGTIFTNSIPTETEFPANVIAELSIPPATGGFYAWKKIYNKRGKTIVIKLYIPSNAKRSNSTGRKCRASRAKVVEGNGYSSFDKNVEYIEGKYVKPIDPFNEDRWNECASGIHFLMTEAEAEAYNL